MKIGTMATYPGRYLSLLEVLPTIAPQLDRLYIYCNEYSEERLLELSDWTDEQQFGCPVFLIEPEFTEGNVRDMGKFWPLGAVDGYVFLLDDDIMYPSDYCQRHIEAIEKHQSVSTVHGRIITQRPMAKYFGDTQSLHYRYGLEKKKKVHIAGTGTAAFKTDYLPELFVSGDCMNKYKGMGDIWFACCMNLHDVDIFCLPRKSRWLTDSKSASKSSSLYDEANNDNKEHCKILNKFTWND